MNFTDFNNYEVFTVLIASVVMPFLQQAIKKAVDLTGLTAYAVAAVFSIVGGIAAAFVSGHWEGGNMAATTAFIFAIAQTIFRFLLSQDRLIDVPLADAD
jgi:hypothetical protein